MAYRTEGSLRTVFKIIFPISVLFNLIVFLYGNYDFAYSSGPKSTIATTSFPQVIKSFPWDALDNALSLRLGGSVTDNAERRLEVVDKYISQLVHMLVPLLIREPLTPINTSCTPSQDRILSPNGFNGTEFHFNETNGSIQSIKCLNNAEFTRKVGVIIQLGFDVDSLEIHLNQLADIVDQFFIIESTRAHYRALRKPIVWELVRGQSRFSKFGDKVTHFLLDDADIVNVVRYNRKSPLSEVPNWGVEFLQERMRWEKFLEWNRATQHFSDDDWIGFGDADEIPSRSAILRLKYCSSDMDIDPVDIGIWFPFGRITQATGPTDHPVPGHPYTLGDPTYWRLRTAKKLAESPGKYPSRMRGKSPRFLLGGMHMTHYGYLPFQIIKRITQTEARWLQQTINMIKQAAVGAESPEDNTVESSQMRIKELEAAFAEPDEPDYIPRISALEEVRKKAEWKMDEIAVLPWFYNCNRQRYPTWEGGHDERID